MKKLIYSIILCSSFTLPYLPIEAAETHVSCSYIKDHKEFRDPFRRKEAARSLGNRAYAEANNCCGKYWANPNFVEKLNEALVVLFQTWFSNSFGAIRTFTATIWQELSDRKQQYLLLMQNCEKGEFYAATLNAYLCFYSYLKGETSSEIVLQSIRCAYEVIDSFLKNYPTIQIEFKEAADAFVATAKSSGNTNSLELYKQGFPHSLSSRSFGAQLAVGVLGLMAIEDYPRFGAIKH